MFVIKSYLNELHDKEFQRIIINFIKEWKDFKQATKKQLNNIKEKKLKENENLSDVQESTNRRLI